MVFTLAKWSPDNCTSKEVPRSTHILRTFEAAKNHSNFVSPNTFQHHVWEYMLSLLKASIGWALSKALSYHSNHFLLSKWMCLNGFSLFFCNECVKGAVNNGVFYCESYRTMDSKKRSHAASGNTPNKPSEKRARDSRRNIRGPLDFSSENVENLENLEPPVNIGGLVSPKIQRRRSGGSPGIKVT